MSFPQSPRVRYENNLVSQFAIDLRCPHLPEVTSLDPRDFHSRIEEHFPYYDCEQVTGEVIDYPPDLTQDMLDEILSHVTVELRHLFSSEPQDSEFASRLLALTPPQLMLQEPVYECWEVSSVAFLQGFQAHREIYHPPHYEMVALSYKNVLVKDEFGFEETPWSELFSPELLGLLPLAMSCGESKYCRSELGLTLTLPNEISADAMIRHGLVTNRETQVSGYLLEFEIHAKGEFSCEDVPTILESLHQEAGNFFRSVCTAKLLEAMRPVEG